MPCYTAFVQTRNVTLSLPQDLLRTAKVIAAQRDTSLSALVGELLDEFVRDESGYEELWTQEEALMRKGLHMRIGEITWSRDDVHQR
jgi:hypothetical protein